MKYIITYSIVERRRTNTYISREVESITQMGAINKLKTFIDPKIRPSFKLKDIQQVA